MEVGEQVASQPENSLMEPASSPGLQIETSLGQSPSEDGVFRLKECCWTRERQDYKRGINGRV